MRAMWLGMAGAVVIAVLAGFALTASEETTGEKYSTDSVRLD